MRHEALDAGVGRWCEGCRIYASGCHHDLYVLPSKCLESHPDEFAVVLELG
jgi:hypothetical protein